ncbi:hypothetical protein HY734_03385 [Candidatus Uhrbacteria bacterium]|nr:hypothetical protein [Candidatus Uhrbacteria bacterium]
MPAVVQLPSVFEAVIRDASRLVPDLRHVRSEEILTLVHRLPPKRQAQTIALRQARSRRRYQPAFPEVVFEGRDIRYLLSFHPRICVASYAVGCDPLETVMHELWHLSPEADGTIRSLRHGCAFNAAVRTCTEAYRRAGGRELPRLEGSERVAIRAWKADETPCVAYVRQDVGICDNRALARSGWRRRWTEEDVALSVVPLAGLLPNVHRYVCPNGHVIQAHVQFRKPRSCATCAPHFDRRFLYRPAALEEGTKIF